MKLFIANTSLRPSYGGPARSVAALAEALADSAIDVGLWAPDQSAADTRFLSTDTRVRRLTGTETEALAQFGEPDVLHDNGVWLPHHHRLAVWAAKRRIPRIVSTRGMLDPWALRHKRYKKQVAWWLYQRGDLQRARCHHTTAEAEAQNVQRLELGVPLAVVPNGVQLPDIAHLGAAEARKRRGRAYRTALFLGRIYPVKGLPMLIEAWRRVRPHDWHLKIAGSDEAGHRAQLEKAIAAARLGGSVSFSGMLEGDEKRAALLDADVFVLPTLSESFGMAIAEALAHGLPVLTTTAAPWPMLTEHGCGWWVPPTTDGLEQALRDVTSCDPAILCQMGEVGRAMVAADLEWAGIAKRFRTLYQQLLSTDSPVQARAS